MLLHNAWRDLVGLAISTAISHCRCPNLVISGMAMLLRKASSIMRSALMS